MSSDIIEQLRRLQQGFSALCSSYAAADALIDEARGFRQAALHYTGHAQPAEASSALASLLQQFVSLHRALLAAPELSLTLGAQFTAACVAMEGCARLAARPPLQANTMFRLASALDLVFGAGPTFLRQCAVPWSGMGMDPAQFLIEGNHQLGAAAAVLHCASPSWHQPAAAEAFVRTAGRPQAVMPWLLAVSQAVLTLPADIQGTISGIRDGSRTSAREVVTNTLRNYAIAANLLLNISSEAFPDAMQRAPSTQQAMLSVLLDRCLPLLAADASPETLGNASHAHHVLACSLCYTVGSRSLWSELARQLEQPQGAAYICQALRVMAALPLHPTSAATRAGSFGEQHAGSILLLGRLCACSPQNGQPDAALAAAAWLFVEYLPHFAAVLAALAADCGIPAQLQARICSSFMAASTMLSQHLPPMSSDSQLAAWAAAAEAALRLAPALLQVHERCQVLDEEPYRAAPALLSQHLIALLNEGQCAANHVLAQFSGPQPPAADERLTRQLWALHTRICRLLQWLLADAPGRRRMLLCGPGAANIRNLLECFSPLRFAVLAHVTCAMDAGVLSPDCLLGVCAAHWAAIRAAVQAVGGLSGCTPVLHHLAVDLHAVNNWSGHVLPDDSLAAMFSSAIALLAPKLSQHPEAERAVKVATSSSGTLAVALAQSAALQGLLEEARRLKRCRNTAAAAALAAVVKNALQTLDRCASEVVAALPGDAVPLLPLAQQLQQAAGVSAGLESSSAAGNVSLLAQLSELSSRLPAAAKLADLLHEWWFPREEPPWQADSRLALAQAAATRSCAYLRCANLGGEGGPAAGEGVGSMRCSACRAVWYCSTACSHADWREGGHRRVCRVLGAARQVAKAAAAAAAEAASSAAAEVQEGS